MIHFTIAIVVPMSHHTVEFVRYIIHNRPIWCCEEEEDHDDHNDAEHTGDPTRTTHTLVRDHVSPRHVVGVVVQYGVAGKEYSSR